MVSAAAFVVTYRDATTVSDREAMHLERQAHDFLNILADNEWNHRGCKGSSELDLVVIEAVAGSKTHWSSRAAKFFGAGVWVDLALEGQSVQYPLHTAWGGWATASETVNFAPAWNWLNAAPAVQPLSGMENLRVDTVGFYESSVEKLRGEPVRSTVTWSAGTAEREEILTTSAFAVPPSGAPGIGLLWTSGVGQTSMLTKNLTIRDTAAHFQTIRVTTLSSSDEPVNNLPAKLRLSIHLPPGWVLDRETTLLASPDWALPDGPGAHDNTTFELSASGLRASDLRVYLVSNGGSQAFAPIHARLSNGAQAESTLLIRRAHSGAITLHRDLFATVPGPVQHGSTPLFGYVFANGGDPVTVTQLDVEIPGGYDIQPWSSPHDGQGAKLFDPSRKVVREDGSVWDEWTVVDEKHLRWAGEVHVPAGEAAQWVFGVPITSDPSQFTSVEGPRSDGVYSILRFPNGFNSTSSRWGPVPGVIRHEVPPESSPGAGDGYPWVALEPGADPAMFQYEVELVSPRVTLRNTSSYLVSPRPAQFVDLQGALANSSFAADAPLAPRGSLVTARADLSNLMTQLASVGASRPMVRVDLFSPPSMGCYPSASFVGDARSLPLAPARALSVGHVAGTPVPRLQFVADDDRAYSVDALNQTAWSSFVQAQGLFMVGTTNPSGESRLLVGDDRGDILRIDPVTGSVHHVVIERAAWAVDKVADPALFLVPDASASRVLIGTMQGALQAHDGDGARLARAESPVRDPYRHGTWVPDADAVVVATARTLHRFDAHLARLPGERTLDEDILAVHATPAGVLVATKSGVLRLDPVTLADARPARSYAPHELREVAVGDATGDGVADLAVARSDLNVIVFSGVTGEPAWSHEPDAALVSRQAERLRHLHASYDGCAVFDLEDRETEGRYADAVVCDALAAAEDHPIHLHASLGRTTYAYAKDAKLHLASLTSDGKQKWAEPLDRARVPIASTMGPWLAPVERVVAVSHADGTIEVRDAQTGAILQEVRTTDFVGEFSFTMRVPRGGFFGPHLLELNLDWALADGTAQSARLTDVFTVTDTDNKPVAQPAYQVHLLVQPRDRSYPDG